MIAIDLSKQQALDADLRAIQRIRFTVNSDRNEDWRMFFILEETKRNYFSQVLQMCFTII